MSSIHALAAAAFLLYKEFQDAAQREADLLLAFTTAKATREDALDKEADYLNRALEDGTLDDPGVNAALEAFEAAGVASKEPFIQAQQKLIEAQDDRRRAGKAWFAAKDLLKQARSEFRERQRGGVGMKF